MKNRFTALPAAWFLLAVSLSVPAHGTTSRYWTVVGDGGDGNWSTGPGDKQWNLDPGTAVGNTTWLDGTDDVAVFHRANGGIVTIFDTVTAAGVLQSGADHTINAGTIVLARDSSANTPFVSVQSGTLTINSQLAGNDGLVKSGTGVLRLTNANPITGSTSIHAGTLALEGSLTSTSLSIASGATLHNQNGGLSNTATLTNAGTLALNADDTIDRYISNGGTLAGGAGTLFVTSADLDSGSTVAGNLTTATMLTSNGTVAISGIATAQQTTLINSGTLTLTGTLNTTNLNIANGATLIQSGVIGPQNPLSAQPLVTNSGTLILEETAEFRTYTSNGGLLDIRGGTMISDRTFLNDGSVTIGRAFSAGWLETNGAVRIENSILGTHAYIQSGVLDLVGGLEAEKVEISSGASLLNQNGGLSSSAGLSNMGLLTMNADDAIHIYASLGGTLTAGAGTLFANNANLRQGSSVAGLMNVQSLLSTGVVNVSGTITAGTATLQGSAFTLGGSLISDSVMIEASSQLINVNGGLSATATVNNRGRLILQTDDRIARYVSTGGNLEPSINWLTVDDAELNDGSVIGGRLRSGVVTSDGAVLLSGRLESPLVDVRSGVMTNTGSLDASAGRLNLSSGATLLANGIQSYGLLTTTGAGTGTWSGDLDNSTIIAPGGADAAGILAVNGNFRQLPAGILRFDISSAGSDRIDVTGSAIFDGSLELNQSGPAIAPFVPITVVTAASHAGNITSLVENLDGAVFFNPANGTVTRIATPAPGGFFGATHNQASTWVSLYDDVIDPGFTNVFNGPGGLVITSGIADAGNPDLMWALAASLTPAGLNAAFLNRLSPEVYAGFSDYAAVATRAHLRSALSAPALGPMDAKFPETSKSGPPGSSKDAISSARTYLEWEVFAAIDHFDAGTSHSPNQADYDFNGTGILAGARTRLHQHNQLAFYLGADTGSISGERIAADVIGWTTGLVAESLLDEKSQFKLIGGIAYGNYQFDGSRSSASATAGGWFPGRTRFDDVETDTFDIMVRAEGVVWQQDGFSIIPSAGLRYGVTRMDSFAESTGAAVGSPIALNVHQDNHEVLHLEIGLLGRMDVTDRFALWGEAGANFGLLDQDRILRAAFANGSRTMSTVAEGLDDDSIYLGFGASYQLSESIHAAFGYRADIRSGADSQHEFRLSSGFRF